jgi:hypothetical protein
MAETTTKKTNLAKAEAPRWETEQEVNQAIREKRVAHVVPGEDGGMPIRIEWPSGHKQEDVVILIGPPVVGIQQTIKSITTEEDGEIQLSRVGSYADGGCGAYAVAGGSK